MAGRTINQYQRSRAVGGRLHLSQIKFRFDNRSDSRHYHRHVIRQAPGHHRRNRHLLDAGYAVARPHSAQHHLRILP